MKFAITNAFLAAMMMTSTMMMSMSTLSAAAAAASEAKKGHLQQQQETMLMSLSETSSSHSLRGGVVDVGVTNYNNYDNNNRMVVKKKKKNRRNLGNNVNTNSTAALVLHQSGENNNNRRKLGDVDWSTVTYNMVSAFGGFIPGVGPLVQFAVYQYYSDNSSDSVWDQIKDIISEMIDWAIIEDNMDDFEGELDNLYDYIELYDAAVENSSDADQWTYLQFVIYTANRLQNMFDLDWDDVSDDSDQMSENYYMMHYAVLLAPLHLSALRDQYLYAKYMNDSNDDMLEVYYDVLEEAASTYKTYFKKMNNNYWDSWRVDRFDIDAWSEWYDFICKWKGYYTVTDDLGVYDTESGSGLWTTGCFNDPDDYAKDKAQDEAEDVRDDFESDATEEFDELISDLDDVYSTIMSDLPDVEEICDFRNGYYYMYNEDEGVTAGCYDSSNFDCIDNGVDNDCTYGDMCINDDDCESGLECSGNVCTEESSSSSSSKRRRRQLLVDDDTYLLDADQWADRSSVCSDHKYKLSLIVGSHMYLVADPVIEEGVTIPAECDQPFLFHRGWEANEVFVREITSEKRRKMNKKRLPLGNYAFSQISQAHNAVGDLGDMGGDLYNIVSNNCADYVAEFFAKMGLNVTHGEIEFVAKNLAKHYGGDVTSAVVGNEEHKTMLGVDATMSDKEIIYKLLEYRAKEVNIML